MHIGSGNTSLSTITLMRLLEHMTNAQRREWLTDGGVNLFAQVYNTNAMISNLRSIIFSCTMLLDNTNNQGATINTISNGEI